MFLKLSRLVTLKGTAMKGKKARHLANRESTHDIFLTSSKSFSNPLRDGAGETIKEIDIKSSTGRCTVLDALMCVYQQQVDVGLCSHNF